MSAAENLAEREDDRPVFEREWMNRFLEALSLMPNVAAAYRSARISKPMVYLERKNNEAFREAWDDALEQGVALLERIAHERATIGEKKRVVRTLTKTVDGKVVETTEAVEETLVVSNAMLIFLLKAHKPKTYRERVEHRHTGADGEGPVQVEVYRKPTRDRMLELVDLARELEVPETLPNGAAAVIEAAPPPEPE